MEMLIIALVFIAVLVVLFVLFLKKRGSSKQVENNSAGINKDVSKALAGDKAKTRLSHKTETYTDPSQFLVSLDLGSSLSSQILGKIEGRTNTRSALKAALLEILQPETANESEQPRTTPNTTIFVGVNGVGKTTSIGKIANLLTKNGHSVVLGAADTFRAAAADQLEIWAKRVGADSVLVIRGEAGADPASIAYKAAEKAVVTNALDLLIDTAGRQQTNKNLMDELGKIKRVIEKHTEIDDVLLVVDGTAGQTASQQAMHFHEVTNITGVVVTKLDGTASGGAVFLVANELKVPIRYIGTGEGIDDIKEFNAEDYVDELLTRFVG